MVSDTPSWCRGDHARRETCASVGNDGAVGSLSFIRVQSGEQLDVDVGEQGHGVDVGCGLWAVAGWLRFHGLVIRVVPRPRVRIRIPDSHRNMSDHVQHFCHVV